ncbi:membrane associated ring-CH-type finger 4b isoform X2 [Salminus brasiliensis]|uniref:membrane associated ring-CH-type finger 4b isoform X2 n=1 Tax=Salminus brasiliensis TaxID=930266 RepID=UPI003B82DC95
MLKGRCCVLFSDLKVLLLRPQASLVPQATQAPQTPPVLSPMSGPSATHRESEGNPCSCAANNNNTSFRLQHWSVPSTDCPVGPETQRTTAAEEFSKDKRDERFSFISYAEGTPVCRICFQGPEQWQAISLTVIEKVQIAAAILGSLFLIASISWLVWSSLSPSAKWQRQDLLFQICYGMYGFMDVVCIALIVHEGPSVFRIFHRWQAVNQKWKVLNYDKKRDSEELKASESEWTLSLMQEQAGAAVSPSTSSLMAAAATASPDTPNAAAAAQDLAHNHSNGPVMPDHHCPYNFLHLLSHLRPLELRSQPSNTSSSPQPRELVMRVTTV